MTKEETLNWLNEATEDQAYMYLARKQAHRHEDDLIGIRKDLYKLRRSDKPLHRAMRKLLGPEKKRHQIELGRCIDIYLALCQSGVVIPDGLNYKLWIEA